MPRKTSKTIRSYTAASNNGSIPELLKELWPAVNLRGSIEPADYKRAAPAAVGRGEGEECRPRMGNE